MSIFAVLGAVNAYFFFFRGGTSLIHLLRITEAGKQAPAAAIAPQAAVAPPAVEVEKPVVAARPPRFPTPPPLEPFDEGRTIEGVVTADESLEAAVTRAGVAPVDVSAIAAAVDKIWVKRPSDVSYVVRFDIDEHLQVVDFRSSRDGVRVARSHGKWSAALDGRSVELRVADVHGTAGWSLFEGVQRAGEQPALAQRLAEVFAPELNLNTEAHPGDLFRVVVEKHLIGGRLDRYGRILAAEWRGRAGTFRAFWFQPHGSDGAYFTERGERVARGLVRSPLRLCKTPATFDRRKLIPVVATEKGSAGAVAWGAPAGTQAVSLGAGKVVAFGPRAGQGLVVVLALSDGVEATYAQLGRLAPGLKVGKAVRPLDVVGAVGTRPLVLSLRREGLPLDAVHLKAARLPPLGSDERVDFADRISPRLKQLLAQL